MRKIICFSVLIILANTISAQTWQWARGSKCLGQEGWLTKADMFGNIFTCGFNYGDSVCLGTQKLSQHYDGFTFQLVLAKYDTSGNIIWLRGNVGNSGSCSPIDIAVDQKGNCYVLCYFMSDSIVFGSHIVTSASPYLNNSFIIKYDNDGNIGWIKNVGLIQANMPWVCPKGIAVDKHGDIYISGGFRNDSLQIGSAIFLNHNNDYSDDIYVARYDSSGNVVWAKTFGGTGYDDAFGIEVSSSDHVYVTGTFSSPTIAFGSTSLTCTSTGNGNLFLVKMDLAGNVQWAIGGSENVEVQCMGLDKLNNIYIAGSLADTVITSGGVSTSVPNAGAFLVKYDEVGDLLWAKALAHIAAPSNRSSIYGLTTDACNNVWVAGYLDKDLRVDEAHILYPAPNSNIINGDAMFLVGYNADGILLDYKAYQTGGDDNMGLSADKAGNIYICGDYDLDHPFILGPDTLNYGHENFFVAKYRPVITCEIVGVPRAPVIPEISLFPNPANNDCTIFCNIETGKKEIRMFNVVGMLVKTITMQGNSVTISLADFSSGLYYCVVKTDATIITQKLVVVKQ